MVDDEQNMALCLSNSTFTFSKVYIYLFQDPSDRLQDLKSIMLNYSVEPHIITSAYKWQLNDESIRLPKEEHFASLYQFWLLSITVRVSFPVSNYEAKE